MNVLMGSKLKKKMWGYTGICMQNCFQHCQAFSNMITISIFLDACFDMDSPNFR